MSCPESNLSLIIVRRIGLEGSSLVGEVSPPAVPGEVSR
jgi:hypothetical protein